MINLYISGMMYCCYIQICGCLQALWGSLALELFSFDIHDFLMAMILQDQFNYVEEYFNHKGARQLLLSVIGFIDQIASNRNIGNWWSTYAR